MTVDRTEDAGELGVLHLTMGGQPMRLRVLTIDESDAWKDQLARRLAALDVMESKADGGDLLAGLFKVGAAARLDVIVAYDLYGVLGGLANVRKRMWQTEATAALEAMAEAEGPFGMADARSVVEAFGRPLQIAAGILRTLEALSPQESSPSGPSPAGASATPTSDEAGPGSSSSSDGPTPDSGSSGKPPSDAT